MRRPYVILNAAMTLDGKITTTEGDSKISCEADLVRLHRLRSEVDAVMVGVGTILADDPSLTVRKIRGKNPLRVVVDGKAKTPSVARVLRGDAKTVIAVSRCAKPEKVKGLRSAGAEVMVVGKRQVDLKKLLARLWSSDIRKLLLEGGSTLNWAMLKEGLVDEIRLCIAPYVVGGEKAKSLVGGKGFPRINQGIKLRLKEIKRIGTDLLLVYKVEARRC
jgi:2,5-diamino-6-(ribosylamino)-4(3H)-pyrimidinone 5'-phosphate reductase